MQKGPDKKVSEAARTLSKLGASKGGKARAEALTPEERQAIARDAITTRWARDKGQTGQQKIPRATHGSPEHPLRIGNVEIPCYVLEDGRRVLVQEHMLNALGMPVSGNRRSGTLNRLHSFVAQKRLKPFISAELLSCTAGPLRFIPLRGPLAYGYEATVLADICEAVLAARDANLLLKQQDHIAIQCDILMRGFARVGIIALIDEVTGYQADRDREELHKILEGYISKELLPWTKRFPDEFYEQMFRLRGWQYHPMTKRGPRKAGELTVHIVYEKLPPGVLEELRSRNPVIREGRRRHRHHQLLTDDIGHEHLKNHLIGVTTLMRAATTWKEFEVALARAFPAHHKSAQIEMALDVKGNYALAASHTREANQEE